MNARSAADAARGEDGVGNDRAVASREVASVAVIALASAMLVAYVCAGRGVGLTSDSIVTTQLAAPPTGKTCP